MDDFFRDPIVQLILWGAVGLMLLAVAIYVVKKIRDEPAQQEPTASELLTKFREMHAEGHLTDEEFRTIKTALAEQLQEELNDSGETG